MTHKLILDKANILIIDDTIANLRLLTRLLNSQGYKVRGVLNAEIALKTILLNPPDLILLDIIMPNMSGYELCSHLKQDERTKNIPIIFISALSEIFDKVKAFTVGGVDYITKPFQREEVLARVKTHLTLHAMQQELELRNEQLEQRVLDRTLVLEKSEEKYRTLFEDSKDPIFIITIEGQVIDVNPACFELLHCNEVQLSYLNQYIKADDFQKFQYQLNQHGAVKNFPMTFYPQEQSERLCLVTATTRQTANETICYQGIIRDITEEKKAEAKIQQANIKLAQAYDETLLGWARALELRDRETEGHSQRVTEMTVQLAQAMGIQGKELADIRRGALLHDIGKMGIPDGILLKPGKLTEAEWEVMHQHPTHAYDMLKSISHLQSALDIPYCHHERWNGSGYPRGLRGEEIPLSARIFAVVDVWDALRSDRPYRNAWSAEKTRDYIKENAGKCFDPEVVELFLSLDFT